MKISTGLSLLLLLLAFVPIALPQDYEDTGIANMDEWKGSSGPEAVKEQDKRDEETAGDDEIPKRTRSRNGNKRRRRLRKRPRTTEATLVDEPKENLDGAEQTAQEVYDRSRRLPDEEEVTPEPEEFPKRRGGKRRRRPYRRYPEVEQVNEGEAEEYPKPPRRRRKGGRKRTRPETVEPVSNDEVLETTTLTEGSDILNGNKQPVEPEITRNEGIYTEGNEETIMATTSTTEIPIIIEYSSKNPIFNRQEFEKTNEEIHQIEEVTTRYTSLLRNKPLIKNTINVEKHERENIDIQKEKQDEKEFGNKIFDRRTLFSKSRRLPETSAVIRRRLVPQKNQSDLNHLRIINPLANLGSQLDNSFLQLTTKSETTVKSEYIEEYTELPLTTEIHRFSDKFKSYISDKLPTTTEEPNYPKFESQKKFTTTKTTTTTQNPSTEKNEDNYFENKVKALIQETDTSTIQTEVNQQYTEKVEIRKDTAETSNVSNLNDSILDLLKTERSRISKILELRNMTIEQLLEHRERGSSKFHWSEIFDESKSKAKEKEKEEEEKEIKNVIEMTTEAKIEQTQNEQIQFPEEEILGSFPKFMSDQIEKHVQQSQKVIINESKSVIQDHREPRVFDSLPEFQTKVPEELPKPFPTWRIIPNPKLKPVSVRGNFEEIKISDVVPPEKPLSNNVIDEIYLLDDGKEFVHHKNKLDPSLGAEIVKSQHNTFSTLKRIPVSVRSAIIISAAILVLAIFGFLSVLISCRVRQKKARLRAKQDILCEHLQNEDFMNSQQSLSPVLNKHQRGPVFNHGIHSNTTSNRHYYLWRTLRKTFQYE